MKKIIWSLIILLLLGCSKGNDPLIGHWRASIEREGKTESFLFGVKKNYLGKYVGSVRSYVDKNLVAHMDLKGISYDGNLVKFVAKTSITIVYQGKMNPQKDLIIGELLYPDGSKLNLNLKKKISDEQKEQAKSEQKVKVNKIIAEIEKGKYGDLNSILISKHDSLIVENYYGEFDKDSPHHIQSVTKSVSSLLIGIAIEQGYIKDENVSLKEFFPTSKINPGITLKQLLTMTTGWDYTPEEEKRFFDNGSSIAEILVKEQKFGVGKNFAYASPPIQLIGEIIEKSTGEDLLGFAERSLFEQLEIMNYKWDKMSEDDLPLTSGALFLLPIDMMKIGTMVKNGGVWKEKRIVSKSWIDKSISLQIDVPKSIDDYGYLWWVGKTSKKENSQQFYFASGRGSQFILIFPDNDLVVVITGENYFNGKEFKVFDLLEEFIML
jgi:CubicO group peptidase (beta-lactamase class C family)